MSGIKTITELQELFSSQLAEYSFPQVPSALYEPMEYIMSIGGKRIRPVLLLAAYNLYKEEVAVAFEGGLALEVFHNFTLLHDDIMDAAEIRRGQPTVHIKYDENKAILTGDVMMIYAYQLLEKYSDYYLPLCKVFTQTSREVCEGQSMDMEFETTDSVTISDYLKMIEYKTSVLIAAALKMGGILAGAPEQDLKHLYEFGKNLGIAFQIQDDLLDTFGTEEQLGKKIGGDIEQKKKTYLYLKSLELLNESQANRLRSIFLDQNLDMDDALVAEVKELLQISHVKVHAEELKLVYQQLSLSHLSAIQVPDEQKIPLQELAHSLLNRTV